MKKIIGGQVYDTDVAKVLATWQKRQRQAPYPDWRDHYESEDLYRTPSGEYFILGYGGRLSRYTPGRPEIRVLTRKGAIQWLKDRGCRLALQKHFPSNTAS